MSTIVSRENDKVTLVDAQGKISLYSVREFVQIVKTLDYTTIRWITGLEKQELYEKIPELVIDT